MTNIVGRRGFIQIPILAVIVALLVTASATIFGQVAQQGRRLETVGQTLTLTATPGCRESTPIISLSWTTVAGESQYQLDRQGGLRVGTNGTAYTDTNVAGGTTYTYQVKGQSTGITSNQVQATAFTPDACSQLGQPQPSPSPTPPAGGLQPSPSPSPQPTTGGAISIILNAEPPQAGTVGQTYMGEKGGLGIFTFFYQLNRYLEPRETTITFRGALPPGLTLNDAVDFITGTPTAAGTYNLTINVTAPSITNLTATRNTVITIGGAAGGIVPTPTPIPTPLPQPTPTPRPSIQPQPTPTPTPTKVGSPTLLSPANGATTSSNPSFDWSDAANADYYTITIARRSLYAGEFFASKKTTESHASWSNGVGWQKLAKNLLALPSRLDAEEYVWFVLAGSYSSQGNESQTWTFIVSSEGGTVPTPTSTPPAGATQQPGTFSLTSPANGATGVSTNPTFDWTDSTAAQGYWIYVSQSSTGWQWSKQTSQSQASWNGGSGWQKMEGVSQEPPSSLANGYGSWFVTAFNSAGMVHSGQAFAFTVSSASTSTQPQPSPTPPAGAALTTPPTGTVVTGGGLLLGGSDRMPETWPGAGPMLIPPTPFVPPSLSGTASIHGILSTADGKPILTNSERVYFVPYGRYCENWMGQQDWTRMGQFRNPSQTPEACVWQFRNQLLDHEENGPEFTINNLPAGDYNIVPGFTTRDVGSRYQNVRYWFTLRAGERLEARITIPLSTEPLPPAAPAFGQPDLSRAPENITPSIPDTPQGPTTGVVGQTYTYTAWTSSPQDNAISMRFVIIPEKGRTVLQPSGIYIPEEDAIFINTAGTNRGCAQLCDRSIDYAFPSPGRYYIAAIGVDEGHSPLWLGPGAFSVAWSPYLTVDISAPGTEAQSMQGGGQGTGGGLLEGITNFFRKLNPFGR